MTLVAMEQANDALIAEITGTSTQLTANAHSTAMQLTADVQNTATQFAINAIETATERAFLSTEYALQQTQEALLALRQGTGVPTPPQISATPYPTDTPIPTPTNIPIHTPISPTTTETSDVNITLTAHILAVESLQAQPTLTPESTPNSPKVEDIPNITNENGDSSANFLHDPNWDAIGVIVAFIFGVVAILIALKQSQK